MFSDLLHVGILQRQPRLQNDAPSCLHFNLCLAASRCFSTVCDRLRHEGDSLGVSFAWETLCSVGERQSWGCRGLSDLDTGAVRGTAPPRPSLAFVQILRSLSKKDASCEASTRRSSAPRVPAKNLGCEQHCRACTWNSTRWYRHGWQSRCDYRAAAVPASTGPVDRPAEVPGPGMCKNCSPPELCHSGYTNDSLVSHLVESGAIAKSHIEASK